MVTTTMRRLTDLEQRLILPFARGLNISDIAHANKLRQEYVGEIIRDLCLYNRQQAREIVRRGTLLPPVSDPDPAPIFRFPVKARPRTRRPAVVSPDPPAGDVVQLVDEHAEEAAAEFFRALVDVMRAQIADRAELASWEPELVDQADVVDVVEPPPPPPADPVVEPPAPAIRPDGRKKKRLTDAEWWQALTAEQRNALLLQVGHRGVTAVRGDAE